MLVFALTGGSESPSVCQNNIPIGTTVPKGVEWHFHPAPCGVISAPGHSGLRGNEIANKPTRDGTVPKYVGPGNIRRKIKCCIDNQHLVMWWSLISTQRQAKK